MSKTRKVILKIGVFRIVVALIVILVILLGTTCKTGYGNICSFGIGEFTLFTCPLGFLQTSLASRELLPQLWLSVALVVLLIILLGRFFCAWICPVFIIRRLFGSKGKLKSNSESPQKRSRWISYSLYVILGGVLLASFILRFPVFCLICPIGLFFGSLFALSRLFTITQPSLELLLFPALLILEIFILKSWCRSICPLGALLGIISRLNRFAIPTVKKNECLNSQGIKCLICKKSCSEGIALENINSGSPLKDCNKCLECYEKCPVKAIGIRLFNPFHRKEN